MPLCLPSGSRTAKIALVGEAPGESEAREGRPFVGSSGQELTKFLARVGISRAECYLTNVMQVRPSANNFGFFYEDPGPRLTAKPELLEGRMRLHHELTALQPNVICCLGGEPLRALIGDRIKTGKRSGDRRGGIDSWRGSILPSPCGKVIGTYHPSYILRSDYSDAPIFQLDLRRVLCESLTPALDPPQFHFEINPTLSRILAFLDTRPPRVAVDIETTGDLVRCLGLADSSRHALCIPFLVGGSGRGSPSPGDTLGFTDLSPTSTSRGSAWSLDDEYQILSALHHFLGDPTVGKVLQNFPFDATILSRQMGLDMPNLHMDTLLAQHTCHPELPKGLDFQASIYTRIPYWSDYDPRDDSSTWLYNCYDAASTFEISTVHDQQLRNLGLAEFYRSHVQPSMLALTRAQNRGIRIDTTLRGKLAVETREGLAKAKGEIRALTGMDLNPNSPKQMQEFLYTRLGMQVQYKKDKATREYKVTCDEEALVKLKKKYPQNARLLDHCLDYRGKIKLLASWLEGKLYHDQRIYTSYSVAGTDTGRISSSGKVIPIILPEEGGNLQQVDRGELRRIFIADPGWVLVKSDLAQADFRVVVWLARIVRLIEQLYNPRFDIHRWNAATNLLRKPEAEVTKHERLISKISIHGSNYGMGPDKAAAQRDFQGFLSQFPNPVAFCRTMQDLYYAAIPEIKGTYWPETQQLLNNTRTLTTPFGRRRMFMGRWNDDLFRQAYAFRPQAVVGDIINRAFSLGNEIFDPNECHPLLQVHDEIDWHCREDLVPTYLPRIRRLMEYPVKFQGVNQPMVIPAEITVGSNWYDQKELTSHGN